MKRTVLGIMLFFAIFPILFGCSTDGRVTASGSGTITIEVVDIDGNVISSVEKDFRRGDTLIGLLQEEFTVYCGDASGNPTEDCSFTEPYGVYLTGLDTVAESGTYVALYVNGEYATTGIDFLEIADGNVYQFRYESF